ncbi:metallophosphoesterase family protein [Patescibacteria group bacterium]
MEIGLVSDLHDHLPEWDKINQKLKDLKIDRVLFMGDTCSPIAAVHMAKTFPGKIDHIFGNVDGDPFLTAQKTAEFKNFTLHGREAEVEITDKKIFMVHYPINAEHAAATSKYDYVFFGHNHEKSEETIGDTKIVNPGTAGGVMQLPTFAVIDLLSGETTFYDVK